jgi:NADP-dependent 3-hydroxy acid dehydrogenase YdfG
MQEILITGAGSGFGEGTALGLAQKGHNVIAAVQTWPQVTALRERAHSLGLKTLKVEKLDLLDSYDVAHTLKLKFDILVNNAGIGEGGPMSEIPVELVRKNFETNVFSALDFTQCVVRNWVAAGIHGKVYSSPQLLDFSPSRRFPLTPRANMLCNRLLKRCTRS